MVQVDRRVEKVVVQRKTKETYSETKGSHNYITLNACISASGQKILPNIIFQESFPSRTSGKISPDRSLYLKSKSAYMDSELFFGFFDRLFIPKTMSIPGPKLLILEGRGSYFNTETVKLCKGNNIHLYCLPPHTTHTFRPLDIVIFYLIKTKPQIGNIRLKKSNEHL